MAKVQDDKAQKLDDFTYDAIASNLDEINLLLGQIKDHNGERRKLQLSIKGLKADNRWLESGDMSLVSMDLIERYIYCIEYNDQREEASEKLRVIFKSLIKDKEDAKD